MPAKDIFHEVVKTALQKDGWQITHDPYILQAGTLELYIDLGYDSFFTTGFIRSVVQQNQIHLIVYDTEQEAIAQWQM